jgi:hypothetical protein
VASSKFLGWQLESQHYSKELLDGLAKIAMIRPTSLRCVFEERWT